MALPSGWKRLEYIEATGTQYIDTGIIPDQDTRVVVDCEMDGSVRWPTPFGAWSAANKQAFIFIYFPDFLQCYTYYGAERKTSPISASGRHVIDANKNAIYIDGELICTHTEQVFSANHSLYFFAYNNIGVPGNISKGKYCEAIVYAKTGIVEHFVACETDEGEVGLWGDKNSEFHGNAGTGKFIAGPELEPDPEPDPEPISPAGDHNIIIGQISREVESPVVLIGGAICEIESGTTLFNGIARDISFGAEKCKITLSGEAMSATDTYIEVDGTKYAPFGQTIEVETEVGTTIKIFAYADITIDGEAKGSGLIEYTVKGDISAVFDLWSIYITTS